MVLQRFQNAYHWLVFYKDAIMCAKILYVSKDKKRDLPKILQLESIKKMIGSHHYESPFTHEELRYIAESIWFLGWTTALFGFAFMFGFFGYESPEQAFKRECNPIRSLLYSRHNICCSICLGPFEPGQRTQEILPCRHYFHANCLEQWLASHDSCPLCRCTATSRTGHDTSLGLRNHR